VARMRVLVVVVIAVLVALATSTTSTSTKWVFSSLDGDVYTLDERDGNLSPQGSFNWTDPPNLEMTLSADLSAGDPAGGVAYFVANNVGEEEASVVIAVDTTSSPITFSSSPILPFSIGGIHVNPSDNTLVVLAITGRTSLQVLSLSPESYKVTNLTTPLEDVELVPSSGTAFNGEEQILTAMLFTHTFGLRLVSLNCSSQAIQWYPQVRVSPVNMAYAPDHGMIIGIAGGGIVPVDAFLLSAEDGSISNVTQITEGLGAFAQVTFAYSSHSGGLLVGVPRFSGSSKITYVDTSSTPFSVVATWHVAYENAQIIVAL